jgi:hypothetical protein
MVSEMRVPYISRDQRSRPCTSVPSRKIVLEASRRRRRRSGAAWSGSGRGTVLEALAKKRTATFSLGIRAIDALEGLGIARALDAVDVGAKRQPSNR